MAEKLAEEEDIVLICGHYEGFDERIRTIATLEISIGDFVVTGGELPALTLARCRWQADSRVLGKIDSAAEESFNNRYVGGTTIYQAGRISRHDRAGGITFGRPQSSGFVAGASKL